METIKVLFVYTDPYGKIHIRGWEMETTPLSKDRDQNISDLIHALVEQDLNRAFEDMLTYYDSADRDILGYLELKLIHTIAYDGNLVFIEPPQVTEE